MNQNVFTRAYLQGLPEDYKQQIISMQIKPFVDMVRGHALGGKTSLMVFESEYLGSPFESEYLGSPQQYPKLTREDFLAGFKKIFPDCDVSYQERWHETSATTRVQQKGILIDWS
jgi:hypothetical protein